MIRRSRGGLVSLGSLLFLLAAAPVSAQCVGDCGQNGDVTINELILGVNIALDILPVSDCPAFANERNEVNIAQLIKGVNNALNGCPEPVATATATSTATGVAATATRTATSPAATATATASAAPPTATSVATSTATGVPTGTAVATATATGIPTGTASAVATATATTGSATAVATATGVATATATGIPTGTASAVATATATGVPTGTTSMVTATATPTATPTETAVPPGEAVGGRAAYMSAGLGGIQALVAAVVTAATNDGGAALVSGLPPPIDTDQCPISGETTQSCTEMGSGAGKTIHLVLGANQCVVPGPLGGTGEFDGSITIDSSPFILNSCSPLVFLSGAYDVTNLTVMLRDSMDVGTTVAADLNGDLAITPMLGACLVSSLSLSVNGTLSSTLMDGSGVEVEFFDTDVTMSNITYSADCVPLVYTLTFNGDAAFTPIAAMPPALTNGVPAEQQFDVSFVNFVMKQNATTTPVTVEMDGTLMSGCLGGQFIMETLAPMAIAAGQLCPNAGEISVTGTGNNPATVTYQSDMSVTVTPDGGQPTNYPSCLVEELQMCVPA